MDYSSLKLGFIGGGNMAKAIVEGILKADLFKPSQIFVSRPGAGNSKKFSHLNIENEIDSNEEVVRSCDVIILCVKPQMLEYVIKTIRNLFNFEKQLILSIVAGTSLAKLEKILLNEDKETTKIRLGRWMLNTAATIGQSCSVYSQNGNLSKEDITLLNSLLSSVGLCVGQVKDSDMDAVTAVCASGIAYMYMMADAMADGGVKMGLTRETAQKLSMQTMKGAAELMLKQFGLKHPMQLKDEVCSPGGTTIHGAHELEKNGFRNSLISAVEAAANRAKQFN